MSYRLDGSDGGVLCCLVEDTRNTTRHTNVSIDGVLTAVIAALAGMGPHEILSTAVK